MYEKWLYMMAMATLVAGAISLLFWTRSLLATVFLTLATLYIGFRRDTYLPFLGETVMPCSLLEEQTPEHADAQVNVSGLVPGAKVLFWAAERNESEPESRGLAKIKDWRRAYLAFANAGVTTADEGGHAVLRVRTPQPYTVPLKGRLEAHVHWRVCRDGGMLGPVETTVLPH